MQIVYGLNPVFEVLKAERRKVEKILFSREEIPAEIVEMCRKRGIPLEKGDPERIVGKGVVHQGIVAITSSYPYLSENELIDSIGKGISLFIDGIEDPRNLGAIIRSAFAFGVEGIFLPHKGTVHITPIVVKSSTGATEWMKIAIVKKPSSTIKRLKEKGFKIVSLDMEGKCAIHEFKPVFPLLLILGSEGKGIKKSLLQISDRVLKIETKISLNVSVACGIALFYFMSHLCGAEGGTCNPVRWNL